MSDLTLGFLPSATFVGGHLNGLEQSSWMLFKLFLDPTGLLGLFLTTVGLLEATGRVVTGLLVANGASNSSTSPTKVGSSSSSSSSKGRMASRIPLLGVVLGASSSVTADPGLGGGLLSGTLPRFLGLPLCRSCSSDLTLGLPPAGREGNRCRAGAAGCTGCSGPTSSKGGVSMSAGKSRVREKSLPTRGGGGVEEKEGLKVAAFPGLKKADDCVPAEIGGLAVVVVLNSVLGVLGCSTSTGIWKKGFLVGLTGRLLGGALNLFPPLLLPPLPRFRRPCTMSDLTLGFLPSGLTSGPRLKSNPAALPWPLLKALISFRLSSSSPSGETNLTSFWSNSTLLPCLFPPCCCGLGKLLLGLLGPRSPWSDFTLGGFPSGLTFGSWNLFLFLFLFFFLLGELIPLMGRLIGRRFPPTANLFLPPLTAPPPLNGGGRRVVVIPMGMAVVDTGGDGGGGRNPFCSSPAKRFPCGLTVGIQWNGPSSYFGLRKKFSTF